LRKGGETKGGPINFAIWGQRSGVEKKRQKDRVVEEGRDGHETAGVKNGSGRRRSKGIERVSS